VDAAAGNPWQKLAGHQLPTALLLLCRALESSAAWHTQDVIASIPSVVKLWLAV
jgi:hypothetical protein